MTILSRSPRGERGLKSVCITAFGVTWASLSSRRAWIEIYSEKSFFFDNCGRSPRGERGLKFALMPRVYAT